MNDKKEIWFIGIGLAAGGFITIFSNFFESILTPFFSDPRSIVFVKTLSGVLAIVCGLGILKWYSKHPPKKLSDDDKCEGLIKVEDKKPHSNNQPSEPNRKFPTNNHPPNNYRSTIKDLIVVIPIVAMVVYGFLYWQGWFEPTYTYNTDFNIHDPADKNRVYHANVILTTKLFAITSTIDAHAIVEVIQGSQPVIPTVYVLFDGSHNVPFERVYPNSEFQTLYSGEINASKVSENLYVGDSKKK